MKIAAIVCALVLGTAARVQAGAAEDIGDELEPFANLEANLGDGTSSEHLADERKTYGKACDAVVAKAAKKLKPDQELVAYRFKDHPKARAEGTKFAVKVSDLPWICDRYRLRLDELALRFTLDLARGSKRTVDAGGLDADQKKNLRAGGAETRREGETCTALVAQARKGGMADDFAIKPKYGASATLAELEAMCPLFAKHADLLDEAWKEVSKEFEKPFVDAGITGDRLSWFVYYGPGIEVWYLKGCKGETSLAKIKKAPLLFQWLTDGDGVITIRRFQWKGDKLVSQTDAKYYTEAAAYKGCR